MLGVSGSSLCCWWSMCAQGVRPAAGNKSAGGRGLAGSPLVLDAAVHLHANDATVGVDVDCARERGPSPAGEERRVVEEAQVAEGHGGDAVRIGAGLGDDRILGPVEIDLAEPASFGDEGGEGGGWLVDGVCPIAAGDGAVVGVGGGDLVELRVSTTVCQWNGLMGYGSAVTRRTGAPL